MNRKDTCVDPSFTAHVDVCLFAISQGMFCLVYAWYALICVYFDVNIWFKHLVNTKGLGVAKL